MANTRLVQLAVAVLAGALTGGGGYAIAAASTTKAIHACLADKSHELLIQRRCRRGQSALT